MKNLLGITAFFVIFLVGSINATEQLTCPVMEGNAVNKNIYVDYKGNRVYFCCPSCKQKFLETPETYIPKLPQFSEHADEHSTNHQHSHDTFSTRQLIAPAGITTFILLLATLSLGIFMKRNRKLLFPWHKRIAILTLIAGLIHASLVIFFH